MDTAIVLITLMVTGNLLAITTEVPMITVIKVRTIIMSMIAMLILAVIANFVVQNSQPQIVLVLRRRRSVWRIGV